MTSANTEFLKQEIERLLTSEEYNTVKNITDEDRELIEKIVETLMDKTSPDDGLTLNQLAQQIHSLKN